jgi:hypothetical protein
MSLNLANAYSLQDLLTAAKYSFQNRTLRQIDFVFSSEQTNYLEFTDARTCRYRYGYKTQGQTYPLAYFDSDKIDVAIEALYKDARLELRKAAMSGGDLLAKVTVELHPAGGGDVVVFTPRPGGFQYVKKTTSQAETA